jgi:type IV pilus assembly protein PilO
MALLDPITNAPKNQKIALGVMACVVVAALGYFLLLSPKQAERDALRQQSEQVRAELAQAQALEASLRGFRAQAEALRKRLEAAQERLPTEKEMPALYRQISDLAFQSGLAMAVFTPRAPEEKEIFFDVPITVNAEGSYHQFGNFLARMGRMPRIVNLTDWRLLGIDRPTGTIRAEVTLMTYIFRPEGAPPPKAAGTPGQPAGANR